MYSDVPFNVPRELNLHTHSSISCCLRHAKGEINYVIYVLVCSSAFSYGTEYNNPAAVSLAMFQDFNGMQLNAWNMTLQITFAYTKSSPSICSINYFQLLVRNVKYHHKLINTKLTKCKSHKSNSKNYSLKDWGLPSENVVLKNSCYKFPLFLSYACITMKICSCNTCGLI